MLVFAGILWFNLTTRKMSLKAYRSDQRGLITPRHFVMKKSRVMRETFFACAVMSFLCGAVTLQAATPALFPAASG